MDKLELESQHDNDNENYKNLDTMINKLNYQIGQMGNNLIEKQTELDYLKEVNEQLKKMNYYLIEQLNKKSKRILMHI
jgi:hypothetical protein